MHELYVRLKWLEERVTQDAAEQCLEMTEEECLQALRALLKKNCMAVGKHRREIDPLSDAEVVELAKQLSSRYGHYLDKAEASLKHNR